MNQGVTYQDLVERVSSYLRMRGPDWNVKIRAMINNAIPLFMRLHEWESLLVTGTITTDGSNSYDLDTEFAAADPVFSVHSVINGTDAYEKRSLHEYQLETDKGAVFSSSGSTLYVEGTGATLTVLYFSPGAPFPFTKTNGENSTLVLGNYPDILEAMIIAEFLRSLHDDTWQQEQEKVNLLVRTAILHQERFVKRGRQIIVARRKD